MIGHTDFLQFIKAISALKNKNLRPPTIVEISKATYLSEGAVEHRIRLLRKAGILIRKGYRDNAVRLEGEMYLPPSWMQMGDDAAKKYIYDKLSGKRQRNSI